MKLRINKYRNKRVVLDGLSFASQKEARRYQELRLLERAKQIKHLECQVPFKLAVNGFLICKYIADYRYMNDKGEWVVEDVKGLRTPVYKIKAKLMKAIFGITVVEI